MPFGPRIASQAKPHRDDWFRGDAWDEAAQAQFAARLARSRSYNRPQYLRIKGLALLDSNDVGKHIFGQRLLEDVVEDEMASAFDKGVSLHRLAAHHHDSGRLAEAEERARAAVAQIAPGFGGGGGIERVELAEILLDRGSGRHLDEARELLDASPLADVPFAMVKFRICLLGVRVSQAASQPEHARRWAESALGIAAMKHSGMRYHPDLGLVTADKATLRWLDAVARSDPMLQLPTSSGPRRRSWRWFRRSR